VRVAVIVVVGVMAVVVKHCAHAGLLDLDAR
jgi:hypothetical protein